MSDLVRVQIDDLEKNVGRDFAELAGLKILDEDPRRPDGRLRGTTRKGGRPVLPRTTVAKKAAAKKAAASTPQGDKS